MEKEENKSGSVYVTVGGYFNPIHISMKGKGKEGFWDFMQEDVEKALRGKEIPTTGVLYYDVPDLAMVPPLRKRNNSNYEPDFPLKSLAVHELSGWPSLMEGKVNLCKN